jgi:hypothetical protein
VRLSPSAAGLPSHALAVAVKPLQRRTPVIRAGWPILERHRSRSKRLAGESGYQRT